MLAKTNKHYRRYYNDELENNKAIFDKMPFETYDIMSGQTRGNQKGGLLSLFVKQTKTEDGQVSTLKKVGLFTGMIDIYNKEDDNKFKEY